jgi:hypothetical protein
VRSVLSEAAEQACGRIFSTLAIGGVTRTDRGLPRRLEGPAAIVLADPRHSLVLPHIVAIVEDFSHQLLVYCTFPLLDLTHPFREDMWREAHERAEGNWSIHLEAWKKWHGVVCTASPHYEALMAFVDARNAIMHGLGRLTRRQLGKDGGKTTINRLATVGIGVRAGRVVLTHAAVRSCAETCRDYVEWLDESVREAGLPVAAA